MNFKDPSPKSCLQIGKNEEIKELNATKYLQKRKRRSTKIEIRSKLSKLKRFIQTSKVPVYFQSSIKKTRGEPGDRSGRRSKYIGVSKNNTNWQALININNFKKYIGTFVSEIEAARSYDLYSVAIQKNKALTNFSYSGSDMIEMIDYFLLNGTVLFNHQD